MDGARMQAAGLSGRIRVGHQIAAELDGWRLVLADKLPRTYVLTAQVAQWDDYWRTRRPYAVALDVGNSIWQWGPVEPVSVTETTVTFEVRGMPTVFRYAAPLVGGVGNE
jgi:hypothetical protein